jgi:hypothetical protein
MELEDQHKRVIKKLVDRTTYLSSLINGLAIIESMAKNPPSFPLNERHLRPLLKQISEDFPGIRFELAAVVSRYEEVLKSFLEEETDHG